MKKVLISLDELQDIICECVDYNEDGESWSIDKQKMRDLFNSQPPAPQWVRVEDGLPPKYKQVFVGDCEYGEARGILDNDDKWLHIFREAHYQCESVTHWMPIPELPEE